MSGASVLLTAPMVGWETRRRILEIIYPLTTFRLSFTFQTPREDDLTGTTFLKPFSTTLWICVVCAILLVGVAMKKTIQLEIRNSLTNNLYLFEPSISLTILSTMGVLCQQGMTLVMKWNTSRILQVFCFFSGLVLYNYYTSLIVSDLISFPKATKVNNLKALLESNLDLAAQNMSYFHYYMQVSCVKCLSN